MEPGKDICLPVIILTEDNSCESNDEGPGCEPAEEEDLCCITDCDGGNATQNNSNQNNMSSSDVVCDNFAPYVGPNSLSGITAASDVMSAPTMGCYRYHPNHQFKPLCKVGGNRELLDIAENFEGGSLGIPEWARLNKMNTQAGSSDEREDEGRGQMNVNNAAGSSSATAMAATCSKSSALPQEEENSNNEEMDVDDGENVPAKKPRAKATDLSKVKKSRGQRQVKKVPKSARKCARKAQKKADDGAKCLRKRSYSKSFPGGVEDRDDDDDDDNDVLYSLAEEHRPREMLQQRGKVHNYNCNSNNNSNKKKAKSRTKKKKIMRRSRRSVNVNSNCNKCLRKKAQARCRIQRTMLDGSRRYCSSLASKQRCSRSRGKEPARRGRSTRSKSRRVCKPSITTDPQNVHSAHGNGNENVNNSNNNNNNVDDDNSFFRRLFFAKKHNSDAEADDASIRTLKSNDSCCNLNDDSANNNNNSNKTKSKAPKDHSRAKLLRKPKASGRRKPSKTGKSARAKKLLLEKYSKVKDTKGLKMKSLVHAKFMIPNKSNLEPLNLPPNYGMVVEEKTTNRTPKRGARNRSAKRTSTRRRPRASAKKSRASSLKSRARSGFGARKSRSLASSKKIQRSRAKSRSKKSKYNLRTISKSKNLNNSDSNSVKNTLEMKSRNERRNDGDSGKDPASGFMTIPMASGNIVKMKKCLPGKKGKASNRNPQVLKSNSRKAQEGETLEMKRSTREEGEHSSFTTIGKTTDLSGRGKRSSKKNFQKTGHEGSLTSGSNTNVNSNHQERSGSLGEPITHRSRSPPKRQNNRRRCRPGRGKGGKASSRVRFRKKKVVHCYNRGK